MTNDHARSTASRVFLTLTLATLLLGATTAALLTWDRQRAGSHEAARVSQAVSTTLAQSPQVRELLEHAESDELTFAAVSATLQQLANPVVELTDLSYVTIMTPDGRRYTHTRQQEIGRSYQGTIPQPATQLTEVHHGSLGTSVRVITPVYSTQLSTVVGWVSAGVTLDTVGAAILAEAPIIATITLIMISIGGAGAVLGRRFTRKLTGTLSASSVQEATSSYETVRALGSQLRQQQHEHGNRIHTAVALIEGGHTAQAVALLTEHPAPPQAVPACPVAHATDDATLQSLLRSKADRARDLGITFTTMIAADAPALGLPAADTVTLIGNLLDNAFDAALDGDQPRTVHLNIECTADGGPSITVTDSGSCTRAHTIATLAAPGFTTKTPPTNIDDDTESGHQLPGLAARRGIGLSLVHQIVTHAGGSVHLTHTPTTIHVQLPRHHSIHAASPECAHAPTAQIRNA